MGAMYSWRRVGRHREGQGPPGWNEVAPSKAQSCSPNCCSVSSIACTTASIWAGAQPPIMPTISSTSSYWWCIIM